MNSSNEHKLNCLARYISRLGREAGINRLYLIGEKNGTKVKKDGSRDMCDWEKDMRVRVYKVWKKEGKYL